MPQFIFDATNIEPAQAFTPIPAGTYVAQIVESEVKPTRAGDGTYLQLTWQVLEGPCAGRKVFGRINNRNPNAQAEQIGQKELSALCHAAGILKITDTQQLHGRPLRIRVAVRKDPTGQYQDNNEVKGYEALASAAPLVQPAAVPPAMPAQPPAARAAEAPPWAAARR
ncbi:MAG: DUF669 domain-containing protein [Burkholderiaceae bacterium]|jgi:hypothetical protein|nr:DUF669 domain-containing protein [Burkholderiaceae bacterium]